MERNDMALPSAALAPSGLSPEDGSQAKQPAANAGRLAKCAYCSNTTADPEAAFREDRGEGSRWATDLCQCGYYLSAHNVPHVGSACKDMRARGPAETDSFYCGCRGWD